MSVDHHFHVPAGMLNNPNWKFDDRSYFSRKEMRDKHGCPGHQVFLAHSCCLVDEQFYFEDAEDARWFYREGYERMLCQGEKQPDRMTLWIDGEKVAEQRNRA